MIINHVGISGGKDSTALLLWAVNESGYPKESILATFCDTGNEDPQTYEYVRFLSENVHPIEWIYPDMNFWELVQFKQRFPSAKARFCTQFLKMIPTQNLISALQAENHDVLMLCGVRAAESDDRAKLPEFEPIGGGGNFFSAPLRRPLLTWSLADIWAMHAKYGIPRNPLYDRGRMRVGCQLCVMSRKREIALVAKDSPEYIDKIRANEIAVRNGCGYSSMYFRNTIPDRYRSKMITASSKKIEPKPETPGMSRLLDVDLKTHTGERTMRVCTIDDVTRWAANDPELYWAEEEFDFYLSEEEAPPACDSRYGACE